MGTFDNININYQQEYVTLRAAMSKCDTSKKFEKVFDATAILLFNCKEEKWCEALISLLEEITRREMLMCFKGLLKED